MLWVYIGGSHNDGYDVQCEVVKSFELYPLAYMLRKYRLIDAVPLLRWTDWSLGIPASKL